VHVNTVDESYVVPKPLLVAVEELGEVAEATVKALRELGADNDSEYQRKSKPAAPVTWMSLETVYTIILLDILWTFLLSDKFM